MTPIEHSISIWLNATTFLVFAGALFYISLLPYMTKDDE